MPTLYWKCTEAKHPKTEPICDFVYCYTVIVYSFWPLSMRWTQQFTVLDWSSQFLNQHSSCNFQDCWEVGKTVEQTLKEWLHIPASDALFVTSILESANCTFIEKIKSLLDRHCQPPGSFVYISRSFTYTHIPPLGICVCFWQQTTLPCPTCFWMSLLNWGLAVGLAPGPRLEVTVFEQGTLHKRMQQ